jgi:hypothetical protein
MLSGNGRHRRPRQAPAIVVAAGVTGSAIALPLLGASGAHAADGTTWDKVAECESGGSWSADTGNGYYGGLQLSQEDWEKYGGLAYASSPDQASRSQQIAVAEKILADQGPGAWPTCGLLSGLTRHSGSIDVDTGVASDSPSPSGTSSGSSNSSGSSGSSHSSGSSGADVRDPGLSGVSSGNSATPSPSSSAPGSADDSVTSDTPSASGKDRSQDRVSGSPSVEASAAGDAAGAGGSTGGADRPAKPADYVGSSALVDTGNLDAAPTAGTGRHRGADADESAVEALSITSAGRHAARDTYTVRVGDTLASIADSLDLDGGWRRLYAENKAAIGSDPSDIVPGQTLDVG